MQYLEFHKNSKHKRFQISIEGLDMEGNPIQHPTYVSDKCLFHQLFTVQIIYLYLDITILDKSLTKPFKECFWTR